LHGALAGAVELSADHARKKGVEMICRVDDKVPSESTGDSGKLRQIDLDPAEKILPNESRGEGVIDKGAIDNLLMLQEFNGKPSFLRNVIEKYLSHSRKLLINLAHAADQDIRADLKACAHSLKSSSANVGAMKLSSLCKEMEATAMEGHIEALRDLLLKIEEEYAKASEALERISSTQTAR
jgi:HPt (histidine-containing phosphotransfer) domain-containing protein